MIPLHRVKSNGKVDLWDLGPVRPDAPEEPKPVDGRLKGTELALAQVEYEDGIDLYKRQLRDYARAKRDYEEWHNNNGGPVKVELWGVDARHAMDIEPIRFKLDLPRNVKPGKAQIEAEEMAALEAEGLDRARASDPQVGRQVSA